MIRTNKPKMLVGIVSSNKMDKTVAVVIERLVLHPRVHKYVRRRTKLYAHDEENIAGIGDVVRISQTRPVSKTKTWRLSELLTPGT